MLKDYFCLLHRFSLLYKRFDCVQGYLPHFSTIITYDILYWAKSLFGVGEDYFFPTCLLRFRQQRTNKHKKKNQDLFFNKQFVVVNIPLSKTVCRLNRGLDNDPRQHRNLKEYFLASGNISKHLKDPTVGLLQKNSVLIFALVMGQGQKFFTRVGSGQFFVVLVKSGQPFMVWVWIWKISPKNIKFFNFFPFRIKKISSSWVGKYPGQQRVGLLFTAGQK